MSTQTGSNVVKVPALYYILLIYNDTAIYVKKNKLVAVSDNIQQLVLK